MGVEVELAATMQLVTAVENDDWDEAEILLHAGGCDVNARTLDFGLSLLQSAAQHGALEVCQLLLAQRADVNAIDGCGKTPLISCIIGGDYGEIVSMLLDARADASCKAHDGSSAIGWAKHVQRNQVVCVLERKGVIQRTSALPVVESPPTLSSSELQEPPATNVPTEPTGTKPTGAENAAQLIEAVENEFWDDAAALLRAGGCDVNAVNARTRDFGCSLLQYAAEHEASDVCQLLLAQRADVHAVDWSRVPPHITSVFSGDKRLASMLTDDSTALKLAKRLRKDEVAFSDVGSSQQADNKGDGKQVVADNTHVIAAVESGAWGEAVELLQARGCDVNARTHDFGHSLLQEAAQQGALDVCRLLLAQRADVNAADATKMTPLISCVIGGDYGQVISTLLDARADASMQAHDGYTAAKWAKRLRRKQVMDALKKAGVHECP